MEHGWRTRTRARWWLAAAVFLTLAGVGRADAAAELRALIEQQRQRIEQQRRQLEQLKKDLGRLEEQADDPPAPGDGAAGTTPAAAAHDPDAVKKVVADYLKDNPGAGVPPSVQTGFFSGQGFVIRSAPDPSYPQWDDESKIPFELRIRGRLILGYYSTR